MFVDLSGVKNIIFDLGGIILNINPKLAKKAFAELGIDDIDDCYHKLKIQELFKNHEKGVITNAQFRDGIRSFITKNPLDAEIDMAWNSMILDIPLYRLDLLKHLKGAYRTFLLSNTNDIHYQYYTNYLKVYAGSKGLEEYFEKAYFSHLMGMRKPNPNIFQTLLKNHSLSAGETLFIDDFDYNTNAAESVGIRTYLHDSSKEICEAFDFH